MNTCILSAHRVVRNRGIQLHLFISTEQVHFCKWCPAREVGYASEWDKDLKYHKFQCFVHFCTVLSVHLSTVINLELFSTVFSQLPYRLKCICLCVTMCAMLLFLVNYYFH